MTFTLALEIRKSSRSMLAAAYPADSREWAWLLGQESDPWNQFHGPNGSGIRKDADIGIPTMEDLLWKTPLAPDFRAVLFGDRIFLTG